MLAFTTLQELLHSAAQYGDRPAIIAFSDNGAKRWTFTEIIVCARRLANGLAAAGVGAGERVGLLAGNRPEWIIACCALLDSGAVPVPIDVQMGDEDLKHILEDSGARWMFTDAGLVERVRKLGSGKGIEPIVLDVPDEAERGWRHFLKEKGDRLPRLEPPDPAVLFYTSGTSGRPKGVALTHDNLTSNLRALLQEGLIQEDERLLMPLPLHHVYPFVVGMMLALAAGVPIILPHALTGPQIIRALQDAEATAIIGVPRLYAALLTAMESRLGRIGGTVFRLGINLSWTLRRFIGLRLGRRLFAPLHRRFGPSLRTVVSGGAALDPSLARQLEALGWTVLTGYGLTETSPILTFHRPGEGRLDSAGQPLKGVRLRIASPEQGYEHGEILAKGLNVFAGYLNLPEASRNAFTDEGFFRTGDLGYLADGFLYVTGRRSATIVLGGGENIRPDYVEEVLSAGASIKEIGVLQRDDALVALVVPEGGAKDSLPDLRERVGKDIRLNSRRLPTHHRIGSYRLTLDPLPKTRLGKLRRHELKQRYEQAGGSEGEHWGEQRGPLSLDRWSAEDRAILEHPAASQTWQWLCERFSDVRLAPDTDMQHDLSVDSMQWVTLTLELREQTGTDLNEDAIGRIESVRDLLQAVAESGPAEEAVFPEDLIERLRQPHALLQEEQRRWLAPRGAWTRLAGEGLLKMNRLIAPRLWKLEVRGIEHLPAEGPYVLTPNHLSLLDPPLLAASLPPRHLANSYWTGWSGIMFRNALMRWLSRATRVVPVDPARGALSNLALGVSVLQSGKNLIWFPEAARSADGRLQRFQPGVGMLVLAGHAPVVPVHIQGTYEVLPRGHRWPQRHPVRITIGPVVTPEQLAGEAGDGLTHERIADALRNRVAQLGDS
ncbi:MAG: AMP-binding protein [Gammaproteobacteria bacterium]